MKFASVLISLAMFVVIVCAEESDEDLKVLLVKNIGDSHNFAFRVHLNSTVLAIKKMIHEEAYSEPQQDRKVLLFNGQVLQDDKTLEDYEIKAHSQIQLVICDDVYNNEMAKSFKAPTNEAEEQSLNGTRVLVKYLETGNVFPMQVDTNKPILSLKEKIERTGVYHFPPRTQVLLSRGSDRVLHDDKTLNYYAVKEDYTVGMVVCK